MYTPIHQIIDFVTHFIGELRIPFEDLRMRLGTEEGPATKPVIDPLALEPGKPVEGKVSDIPVGRVGKGEYVLPGTETALEEEPEVNLHVPLIHTDAWAPMPASFFDDDFFKEGTGSPQYLIPPPGDFAAIIQQHTFLFDQDIVVVGNPEFAIPLPEQPVLQLLALEQEARESLSGFSSLEPHHSVSGLSKLVTGTYETVVAAEAPTATAPALAGPWLNGTPVEDEVPDLDDALPSKLKLDAIRNGESTDQEETSKPHSDSVEIDASGTNTTMEISSGGNLLLNQTKIIEAGVTATTIAVGGNNYCIDVIVQANVLSSAVQWESAVPDGMECTVSEDVLVNLAEFTKLTHDKAGDAAEARPDIFPQNWAVAIIEGDLTTVNWVQQYNFMADGDTLVLTATGTTTTIETGGNIQMNATSITYMGNAYDLLLIGGNLYDLNYISQINILYNHDQIGAVGAMPGNVGTIETGGDVLWNQATIARIGASDWQQGVPSHYTDAMTRLDNGNAAMPESFSSDPNFEGHANLKVLYITGNVYDINYVEQVNVMGDPDKVILYAEEAFDKNVEWNVQTGGNALVNAAAIVDHQSMGDTAYVGGAHYSQAMLIQSEIIKTGPDAPVQMVSEAVVFIADDLDIESEDLSDSLGLAALASQPVDGLDAILA